MSQYDPEWLIWTLNIPNNFNFTDVSNRDCNNVFNVCSWSLCVPLPREEVSCLQDSVKSFFHFLVLCWCSFHFRWQVAMLTQCCNFFTTVAFKWHVQLNIKLAPTCVTRCILLRKAYSPTQPTENAH